MSFITRLAVVLVLVTLLASSHAITMERVYDAIEDDERENSAKPPTPSVPDPYPYSNKLKFTITALSSHSFRHLFTKGRSANTIVGTWYQNVSSLPCNEFGDLQCSLLSLKNALGNPGVSISFGEMVRQLHLDKLDTSLSKPITDLMTAGFQFPLFKPELDEADRKEMYTLLSRFVKKHQNLSVGAFGSLTWSELFYSPADDTHFNERKIDQYLQPMQGIILPMPYQLGTSEVGVAAVSARCCNTYGHNRYRQCSPAPTGSCTTCNGFCCLAGVIWFAPNHPDDHPIQTDIE